MMKIRQQKVMGQQIETTRQNKLSLVNQEMKEAEGMPGT